MKKNYVVHIHNPGPVTMAIVQVAGLFAEIGDKAASIDVADVVLVNSREELNDIYRSDKPIGLVCIGGKAVAENLPENVFAITAIDIIDPEAGLVGFLGWLEGWFARHDVPVEAVLTAFTCPPDLAKFKRQYNVLAVDNNQNNRFLAEKLLDAAGQVYHVCPTLKAAALIQNVRFDAVLTDMQMPLDRHYSSLAASAINPAQEVPYGFAAVFEFTKRGLPVAVVTDGNHHQDWVSAMFDHIKDATVNGQKVLFLNHIGKRWDKALKSLLEP